MSKAKTAVKFRSKKLWADPAALNGTSYPGPVSCSPTGLIKKDVYGSGNSGCSEKETNTQKKSLLLAARLVLEQGTHLDPVTRDGT